VWEHEGLLSLWEDLGNHITLLWLFPIQRFSARNVHLRGSDTRVKYPYVILFLCQVEWKPYSCLESWVKFDSCVVHKSKMYRNRRQSFTLYNWFLLCREIVVASPVEDYFLYIDDLPPEAKVFIWQNIQGVHFSSFMLLLLWFNGGIKLQMGHVHWHKILTAWQSWCNFAGTSRVGDKGIFGCIGWWLCCILSRYTFWSEQIRIRCTLGNGHVGIHLQ
jgi:hypothetical protein